MTQMIIFKKLNFGGKGSGIMTKKEKINSVLIIKILSEIHKQFNTGNVNEQNEPKALVYLKNGHTIEVVRKKRDLPQIKEYYVAKLCCSNGDSETFTSTNATPTDLPHLVKRILVSEKSK